MAAESISPWFVIPIVSAGALPWIFHGWRLYLDYKLSKASRVEVSRLESKVSSSSQVIGYVWDIARVKLEEYFSRNLSQVKQIFWASISAMSVGFMLIMFGVMRSLANPQDLSATYVSVVSGIVTEFISVTFMTIYRSTLQQASSYMSVLERINSVGMAVQILESMGSEDAELKDATRAELVKLLLEQKPSPRSVLR